MESSSTSSGSPRRFRAYREAPKVGEIGFLAHNAVQQGVDRRHHLHYYPDLATPGLAGTVYNQKNNFTTLPGITFNERTFQKYMYTAETLRQSRSPSPTRRFLSPTRRPASPSTYM